MNDDRQLMNATTLIDSHSLSYQLCAASNFHDIFVFASYTAMTKGRKTLIIGDCCPIPTI